MTPEFAAIELEAIHALNGHIEVVRSDGLAIHGYALYLRALNGRGDALAEWLCDHPHREWLQEVGILLATTYAIPLYDYTPQGLVLSVN